MLGFDLPTDAPTASPTIQTVKLDIPDSTDEGDNSGSEEESEDFEAGGNAFTKEEEELVQSNAGFRSMLLGVLVPLAMYLAV